MPLWRSLNVTHPRRSQRLGAILASALVAGALGAAGLAAPATAAGPPAEPGMIPGAWIVTLNDGGSPDRVADDHRRNHGAQIDHVYRHALNGYAARMSDEAAARVARDSRVQTVQRDRVVAIAGKPVKGGGTTQTVPTGIDRIDSEVSSTRSGDGSGAVVVDVAVIDTGIDTTHPDLNVVGGKNCSSGSSFNDGNGHGTHVAGTIAAKDDGQGVVGVVPGARLYAVRVLNNAGSGSWSSVACGVDYVTSMASTIEVANMSLGGSGTEPPASGCSTGDALHDAICNSVDAGVTYAVAAGNSSADAATFVPAAYDEVITVSALADFDGKPGELRSPTCRTDEDDTFASFSNFGNDVDLIAPGVCIASTWKDGGYSTISGTSMASPHVAGAAALYKATNTAAVPSVVKAALQDPAKITLDWNDVDDPDDVKERLLNVAGF